MFKPGYSEAKKPKITDEFSYKQT
uniref:Protein male-specific 40 n=1 Tax=Drosophila melanogaster TaxID=7227 RepID=MST40_DROME|nr:RecName: Full=Protein male-specific 40 [Drosophila melanogaster]CAA80303.1 ORF1 [Drosophila melanogaster]